MKFILATQLVLLSAIASFAQEGPSPVGLWRTIDDETKAAKSIVEIREVDGMLEGKILKLFRKPDEDQNPKCDKCKNELKDQPIIGLKILNNMKKSDDQWVGGEILDPKNGKTYSCKLEVIEEGKKLKVRGFIGFSLLGRTQVWERETEAPIMESAPVAAEVVLTPAGETATTTEKKSEAPAEKKAKKKKK